MLTAVELARLVRDMRRLQIEFFTTKAADRPPDLVGRAKAMERQVDRAVAALLAPRDEATLFGPEGD